jgi:hypothetical protein
MCEYGEHRVRARLYLSQAKKRNKHLKKLKSVSRAYRKSEVRALKAKAHDAEMAAEAEKAKREIGQYQAEMLRLANSYNVNHVYKRPTKSFRWW